MKTRAAVLTAINTPLEIVELEQEAPKAGEVRVEVKAAGVCMSDWHIINGDWPMPLPMVLGHEAAGIVREIGPGVTAVGAGDHVIFSFHADCGRCRHCAEGNRVRCTGHNAAPIGTMFDGTARLRRNAQPVTQMARIGTFSQSVVCSQENVVAVRKDLPWAHAAVIGCSVATGVGAVVRHAKVPAGASVVVIGCGGVGLNIVQGARLVGAQTIVAVDLKDSKLAYAKTLGATHTINAQGTDVVKAVRQIVGKAGADFAFDAIGSAVTAAQVVQAVAAGGHAVLVGMPAVNVKAEISPFQMVMMEKKLTGSYYGSIRPSVDFPMLADLAVSGRITLDPLISKTYRLDEINAGFENLVQGAVARGVVMF